MLDKLRFIATNRENVPWSRVNTNALFGGLSAALLAKLFGASNAAALGWGAAGWLGTGYGTMLYNNAKTQYGGRYLENPEYYDRAKLRQMLQEGGRKRITFYVPGANYSPADRQAADILAQHGIYSFAWADQDVLRDALNEFGGEYDIDLIGHSAGGAAITDILPDVRPKLSSVHLLDPTEPNPMRAFTRLFTGVPEHNQPRVHTYVPEGGGTGYLPGFWRNLGIDPHLVSMSHKVPNSSLTAQGPDHSLHITGLRRPVAADRLAEWAERLPETLDWWRNRHGDITR